MALPVQSTTHVLPAGKPIYIRVHGAPLMRLSGRCRVIFEEKREVEPTFADDMIAALYFSVASVSREIQIHDRPLLSVNKITVSQVDSRGQGVSLIDIAKGELIANYVPQSGVLSCPNCNVELIPMPEELGIAGSPAIAAAMPQAQVADTGWINTAPGVRLFTIDEEEINGS